MLLTKLLLKLDINLNEVLKDLTLKKHYIKKINERSNAMLLIKEKNYRLLNNHLAFNYLLNKKTNDNVVMYVIDITFSRSNTYLHVANSAGKLKFFSSAGCLRHKGKSKKFRYKVLQSIYKVLFNRLTYLRNKPVALHLKNVGSKSRPWVIKTLKKRIFLKTVRIFNLFPFNGCRNAKVRRKKMRKRKKIKKIVRRK